MRCLGVAVSLMLLFCSCGEQERGNRKETFPIKGVIHVDGSPVQWLQVICHDVKGIDAESPTKSSAYTDEEGKFEISTYESADGVPEGEYALTFMWGKMNMISMSYGGPDKLNGRYSDPAKSGHRVTVKAGEEIDLETIELTTK